MSLLGRGGATGLGQTSLRFRPQSPAMWTGTPLRALALGNLRGGVGQVTPQEPSEKSTEASRPGRP